MKIKTVAGKKVRKAEESSNPVIAYKYAHIKSYTREGVFYTVVKYRKAFIVGPTNSVLRYGCTCLSYLFRLKPCKHIISFKKNERSKK